jgi:hypothetical protein
MTRVTYTFHEAKIFLIRIYSAKDIHVQELYIQII